LIRDEGDASTVRRPARIGLIPIAIGDGEGIAARNRHHPQIMPGSPLVRTVDQARTVRRHVGSRLPIGFLVVNLPRVPAVRGLPPETAGAVDVISIRHVQHIAAVAGPYRIDLVVIRAVVVTRQLAAMFAGEPCHMGQRAILEVGSENMKALIEQRRDEYDALAVG
jgi:hypothetical protein